MKTRNQILAVALLFLVGIVKFYGQTNAVYYPNTATPNGASVSLGNNANPFTSASATWNTFIGANAGITNTTGNSNTFIGYVSGSGNTTSTGNTALGVGSYQSSTGTENIGIGLNAATLVVGNTNVFIGRTTGNNVNGSGNLFLGGNINFGAATNISNTSIIADGVGNQRIYAHSNGCVGIGLGNFTIPQNRLEINSVWNVAGLAPGTLGLRFRGVDVTTATSIVNPTNKVLSVNTNGDIILVNDVAGTGSGTTFTTTCGTNNFIPKSTSASSMACSQIFDNGTSVGINTTGPFTYNNATNPPFSGGTVPNTGTVRLDVNGVIRTVGIFATSDRKFKKDIKSIENPLEAIQKLDGKTYFWNKEANKEMEFDNGLHSGFIAQELEKVFPHLVATDEKGNKAVNYMELMPYLVEAIKEQQTQINDLKSQISEHFKAQNQDLIKLTNTKIISVSPNPSNDVITISFNIEPSVQSAKLQVHDLSGNVISSLNINDRENNITRTLQKDNFGKGIYVVTLVVNGKSIDAKKIIFN
ncbi:tail fiber domain-containing protein [Flavobacterium sp.]|uniref:tail fiber domain-containing protein n=1 Tax=Flavobacterium sp. TaxID=239 RepID=UPI002609B462|nr:tail fiber domain-containing protein [Flavobacterium sp.]